VGPGVMARIQSSRGFGLVEGVVAAAIMAMGVLIAMPFAGTMIRRAEGVGAVNTIRAALASARLQAVKTGSNVVLVITQNSDSSIHLASFRDKASLTGVSANDGNGVQDAGEPSFPPMDVDAHLRFWRWGGARDDTNTGVAFDGYVVNGSLDAGLTHRVIFLPTGGILLPQNGNSGSPSATAPFGRGIYFADVIGKNFFRITVSTAVASGARVDKYVPGKGYVSGNWSWN
jgi:type II secretory pathway pseudopilin PulG